MTVGTDLAVVGPDWPAPPGVHAFVTGRAGGVSAGPCGLDGDLPGGWTDDAVNGRYGHYNRFTYRDRKHDFWVYRGPHAGLVPLEAGTYHPADGTFSDACEAK